MHFDKWYSPSPWKPSKDILCDIELFFAYCLHDMHQSRNWQNHKILSMHKKKELLPSTLMSKKCLSVTLFCLRGYKNNFATFFSAVNSSIIDMMCLRTMKLKVVSVFLIGGTLFMLALYHQTPKIISENRWKFLLKYQSLIVLLPFKYMTPILLIKWSSIAMYFWPKLSHRWATFRPPAAYFHMGWVPHSLYLFY